MRKDNRNRCPGAFSSKTIVFEVPYAMLVNLQ